MDNHATRGRATGSRGRRRKQSENPHHNRNSSPNSGHNRQRAAAHVQDLGRGRSFRDPATPHSAAPGGYGGDGGRGSGGRGCGRRDGAHYASRQPSSEPDATTAALATMGASGQQSQPAINSFSMTTAFSGSSTTSVTDFPGAQNQHRQSHQCSVLISCHMGPGVCRLQFVLAVFITIFFFFVIIDRFKEIGNFPKVDADPKNRMILG